MRKSVILISALFLCSFAFAQDFVIKQDNTRFVQKFIDYNLSEDKLIYEDLSEQRYNIKINYESFEKVGYTKKETFDKIIATFVLLERQAGYAGKQMLEDLKKTEKPLEISLGSTLGTAGVYDQEKNRIEVANLREDIKEVLIHEITHYIQGDKLKKLGYDELDKDITKITDTNNYYLNAYLMEANAFAYQYTISEIAKPHMDKNLRELLELEDYNFSIIDNSLELLAKNFESFFQNKNYIINTAFKKLMYGTYDNNIKFYLYTVNGYQQSNRIFHNMKVSLRINDENHFFNKNKNTNRKQVCVKNKSVDMSEIILAYAQVGDKNYFTNIKSEFKTPEKLSAHILYSFDKFLKRKVLYSLEEREEILQEFCSRF